MAHWLLKSEPSTYSIDDFEREGATSWDGVRSYTARNNLQAMRVGEQALFYHSSVDPAGVLGVCEVVREAYPDDTAWDPSGPYFDPRSQPSAPRWVRVDVRFVERFPRMVTLAEMRATPGLDDMVLLRKGMRLSVQPVTGDEWEVVTKLARL